VKKRKLREKKTTSYLRITSYFHTDRISQSDQFAGGDDDAASALIGSDAGGKNVAGGWGGREGKRRETCLEGGKEDHSRPFQ